MSDLTEAGRVLSGKHETILSSAHKAIGSVLGALKKKPKPEMKEAADFNQNDVREILRNEMRELDSNAYIIDVFDTFLVYQSGYNSEYMRRDYTLDTTGNVAFSDPIEVIRKVTYIDAPEPDDEPIAIASAESSTIEFDSACIPLIERAIDVDGAVMLKLIAPGEGSSGYYSEAVLRRDGPKVFVKGLHNYIDHPTQQEEAAKPEGSIHKLGSTLVEDAKWLDSYVSGGKDQGAGLYARAKVIPAFGAALDTIAPHIGVSIRASGNARMGVVNGKQMPVIESITAAKSVDYVTVAGAGGKVLSLVESAVKAPILEKETYTMNEAEIKAMRDQLATLNRSVAEVRAHEIVAQELPHNLPSVIRDRLARRLSESLPFDANGALDSVKLVENIKAAITAETQYITSIAGGSMGLIKGFGAAPVEDDTAFNFDDEMGKIFGSWGMAESAVKTAVAGRDIEE